MAWATTLLLPIIGALLCVHSSSQTNNEIVTPELLDQEKIIEEKTIENQQLRQKIEDLEDSLNEKEILNNILQIEVIKLQEQNTKLNSEIAILNSQIADQNVNLKQPIIDIVDRLNEIKALKLKNTKIEQKLESCKLNKNICEMNTGKLTQNISGLKTKIETEKSNCLLQISESNNNNKKTFNEFSNFLTKLFDLGFKYNKKAKYTESLEIFKITLIGRENILGPDNLDYLQTKHWIGIVLYNLKKYEDALNIFREVFEKRQIILGDHIDTLRTKGDIATTLFKLGRFSEALDIYKENVEAKKIVFGENHKFTLLEMHNMATCLKNLGRTSEALKLFQETLQREIEFLGRDDPLTLNTQSWINNF